MDTYGGNAKCGNKVRNLKIRNEYLYFQTLFINKK